MTTLRLTLAILLLTGFANASVHYQQIDTTNFANNAAVFEGRLVAVTGRVCTVNADGKSVRLFDEESKALIEVSLVQMKRSQRRELMMTGVKQVAVYGKAEVKNGKLIINAHSITAAN